MFRIAFMGGVFAYPIINVPKDSSAIQALVKSGVPILIVRNLEEVVDLGLVESTKKINIVDVGNNP